MSFPLRTSAAITLGFSLVLTGCSSDSPNAPEEQGNVSALEGIEFTEKDGKVSATLDDPVDAEEISTRVLREGDGEEIDSGDSAILHIAAIDPQSGEITDHDFDSAGSALLVDEQLKSRSPELYEVLQGNKIGSQIAYFVPEGTYGATIPAQLLVVEIVDVMPSKATGEEVEESQLDESLPKVTRDEKSGEPTIEKPTGKAPKDLKTQVLVQGDGPKVTMDSEVTVQYRGIKWSDGEEFDSSWSRGEPTSFPLSNVVKGWQDGLSGQQVGSQVMVVVPPQLGYGDSEGHELQKETMVFVVDILHATETE